MVKCSATKRKAKALMVPLRMLGHCGKGTLEISNTMAANNTDLCRFYGDIKFIAMVESPLVAAEGKTLRRERPED